MKRLCFLFLVVFVVVIVGCAASSSLWSQAKKVGEDKVFSANVGGKNQKCVWVSAIGHPEHAARHKAHRKGLRILGSSAYDIDVKVAHRSDGKCRIDMLMTKR